MLNQHQPSNFLIGHGWVSVIVAIDGERLWGLGIEHLRSPVAATSRINLIHFFPLQSHRVS